jgi:hypothetical protein
VTLINADSVLGLPLSANIDFDSLQNTTVGGIAIGASRSAHLLVINTSHDTNLTVSGVSVTGVDAADFSIDPASRAAAVGSTLPPNQTAFAELLVVFSPRAAGLRKAEIVVTTSAGTVSSAVSGTGL